LRLEGKRALVTGGGRGIGAAIARLLDADDADAALNYVAHVKSAEAVAHELRDTGRRATALQAELSDIPNQLRRFIAGPGRRCTPTRTRPRGM
jgi:3-oxoacyl-[acyl-carrier protein] reductase